MIQKLLRTVTESFHLNAAEVAEFRKMKVNGMTFHIWAFEAEGLGHVSAMSATGFLGLMNMDTLIINPTQADMPLLSYDRVHALGNDTLIVELYDTVTGEADLSALAAVKNAHASLPDHDLGTHWYDSIKLPESISKKGRKKQTPAFDALTQAYMDAYLTCCKAAGPCSAAAKREKASVYVEGLLSNGGPSTDVFMKAMGPEQTARLFRLVLFGTEI